MKKNILLLGLGVIFCGPGCKESAPQSTGKKKVQTMASAPMVMAPDGLPELNSHERSNIPTCDLYLRFMKCLGARVKDKFVAKAAGLVQAGIRGLKRRANVDSMLQEQLARTCHGQLTQMRDKWKGRTEVQECLDHVQDIPTP